MKPLTKKDLPALAEIIKKTIHRNVYIKESTIFIKCNERIIARVIIKKGRAFSDRILMDIPLKPKHNALVWKWEILI